MRSIHYFDRQRKTLIVKVDNHSWRNFVGLYLITISQAYSQNIYFWIVLYLH